MLLRKKCDIVMASRKITDGEYSSLWDEYGELTAFGNENVIALDGISIIVHPSNPVEHLSNIQLKKIYTGVYTKWSDILGTEYRDDPLYSKQILIYSRPRNDSGTFDGFADKILGNIYLLADGIKEVKDSKILSEQVAITKNSIGFVGYPFIGQAIKPVAIFNSDEKGMPTTESLYPDPKTISLETYLLSRRLYLYIPEKIKNKNNLARRFIDFANNQGPLIEKLHYIDAKKVYDKTTERKDKDNLINAIIEGNKNLDQLPENEKLYNSLKKEAGEPIKLFFFKSCSDLLDNKAMEDLKNVSDYINKNSFKHIFVFGHTDNQGTPTVNSDLSRLRSEIVAKELKKHDIKPEIVTGLGSHWPIDSNESPDGRLKNRRVEIWVKR